MTIIRSALIPGSGLRSPFSQHTTELRLYPSILANSVCVTLRHNHSPAAFLARAACSGVNSSILLPLIVGIISSIFGYWLDTVKC